jgi:hypothetical protein
MGSFQDEVKKQMEENKGLNASSESSEYFKFKEGENVVRVMTKPVLFFEKFKVGVCFHECGYQGTAKLLAWVIDRADKKMKLMRIPYGVMEDVFVLESDEDKGFKGFPMPYDLKIVAKGAGTKDVKYTVMDKAPKTIEKDYLDEVAKKTECGVIIEKWKEKQKEKMAADKSYAKMAEAEDEETIEA